MIGLWMLSTIVLGFVFLLGGFSAAYLWPRFGLPRRWLWLALMMLSIGVPVAMAFRHATLPDSAPIAVDNAGPQDQGALPTARTTSSHGSANSALLVAWGATSFLLALFFAATQRRILAQVASWQSREVSGEMVVVSPDFGPAAVGLLHARVVLPEWVLQLPSEEQRLVLLHEREHVAAGDHLLLLSGVVMVVLMPWNLGLWWQLRRLRVGMELDCDARVAPRVADRPRYGQLLLESQTRHRTHPAALAFVPAPSVLGERLSALLESARLSRKRMLTCGISAVACAVAVTRVPVPSLEPLIQRATRHSVNPVTIARRSTAPRHELSVDSVLPQPRRAVTPVRHADKRIASGASVTIHDSTPSRNAIDSAANSPVVPRETIEIAPAVSTGRPDSSILRQGYAPMPTSGAAPATVVRGQITGAGEAARATMGRISGALVRRLPPDGGSGRPDSTMIPVGGVHRSPGSQIPPADTLPPFRS